MKSRESTGFGARNIEDGVLERGKMRIPVVLAVVLSAISVAYAGERGAVDMNTRILLKFNNEELTARLNDSQASSDFIAMLPMTLTFKDYSATEKVSDLPNPLDLDGSPSGFKASAGDVTYYAPWGNLAIFESVR